LITTGMVESMKPGSVIVDLAAEQGGNCALTEPGRVIHHKGVTIIGYTDLPSRMASMSSQLYGACVTALLEDLIGTPAPLPAMSAEHEQASKPTLVVDLEDEVVRGAIVLHEGKMLWPAPVKEQPPPPEPGVPTKSSAAVAATKTASGGHGHDEGSGINPLFLIVIGIVLLALGFFVPTEQATAKGNLLSHLTVFILAVFVGFQVVWNVKPALHTPLMSVTNAISGIILVGGMLQLSGEINLTTILGAVAVFIAAVNIAGGFLVTNRMLAMFRK
jgi:NAD(P) transhydrogenase subunit alpha